jgi:hypothetical protein
VVGSADDTAEQQPGANVAQRTARSPALRHLAQLGLAGYGLLHLIVAWLALQLAWWPGTATGTNRTTDQAGALAVLARSPAGTVLLWALAVGLGGLALWQAVEVVRHHRRVPPPGPERRRALFQALKTVGTALLYGFLALSAARAGAGESQHRGDEQQTARGGVGWAGGQVLVVAVGLVVIGIGAYVVRKGLRSDFLDEIDLASITPALCVLTHRFSQVGFVLKGVALVLVGGVVVWAAAAFDPKRATGLDGALRAIAAEPYGRWVLTAIAAGLAAFAVYCAARARHPVG